MPTVYLTRYECERSLVPRLCARCGMPADDAIGVAVITPAIHGLLGTLLILCPPLLLLIVWRLQGRPHLRMPMCPTDRADWQWRDRVTTRTYLVVVGAYLAAAVVLLGTPGWLDWEVMAGLSVAGYFAVWNVWMVPAVLVWTRTVRATKVMAEGLRFSGLHPAFVAAVREDRSRDPDPARQARFGDVRDDYDDGPESEA